MARIDSADEDLIGALAQQDLSALEVLYDRYGKVAFSLAYRIVGDRGTAEDVVQDSFLSVWRQAKSYKRERGSPKTWLMAIVHHRSIDRLRGWMLGLLSRLDDEGLDATSLERGDEAALAERRKGELLAVCSELASDVRWARGRTQRKPG